MARDGGAQKFSDLNGLQLKPSLKSCISPQREYLSVQIKSPACECFPLQAEPAVCDLRRGSAVWDGKRAVVEETFTVGEVRKTLMCSAHVVMSPPHHSFTVNSRL